MFKKRAGAAEERIGEKILLLLLSLPARRERLCWTGTITYSQAWQTVDARTLRFVL